MIEELYWHRQLRNFKKALGVLTRIIRQIEKEGLNETLKLASILSFTQNFTLAIYCMLAFFQDQGDVYLEPGKMIIRLAFRRGLIEDGDVWMNMLKMYKKQDEAYLKPTADMIAKKTIKNFYPVFLKLLKTLDEYKLRIQT